MSGTNINQWRDHIPRYAVEVICRHTRRPRIFFGWEGTIPEREEFIVLIEHAAIQAEAIAVPDTPVSRIANIEDLPGGLLRFSFFGPDGVTLAPIHIVMHADNVLAGAKQALLKVVGLADVIAQGLPDHLH